MSDFKALGNHPHFPGMGVRYQSKEGYIVSDAFGGPDIQEKLKKSLDAREDDIYVTSFPKAGSNWVQEIAYLIATDLDFKGAKSQRIHVRSPFMDTENDGNLDKKLNVKSPRIIKTHYPYGLLPKQVLEKNCKIINVIRNPKDTVVSYYHLSKAVTELSFHGDFTHFLDNFLEGKVLYTPYWKHILSYWQRKDQDNILILFYEDMKKDLPNAIRKIAAFLGKTLSDDQVQELAKHCNFKEMKNNPNINYALMTNGSPITFQRNAQNGFMRKGEVGDWKSSLTVEMSKQLDEYVSKYLGASGIQFTYEN